MENDKDLYKSFLDGDSESFEKIVLKYKDSIIYFISRYTKDIDIAEDISQDVFVYILLNKEKYDFNYSLKTYLYIIAKSRAINYIKKESKVVSFNEIEKFCSEDEELEEKIFKDNKAKQLRKHIKELKPDYQAIIYLLDIEEYGYSEAAEIMNKSVIQIKTLAHNAREKLKKVCRKESAVYEG